MMALTAQEMGNFMNFMKSHIIACNFHPTQDSFNQLIIYHSLF